MPYAILAPRVATAGVNNPAAETLMCLLFAFCAPLRHRSLAACRGDGTPRGARVGQRPVHVPGRLRPSPLRPVPAWVGTPEHHSLSSKCQEGFVVRGHL